MLASGVNTILMSTWCFINSLYCIHTSFCAIFVHVKFEFFIHLPLSLFLCQYQRENDACYRLKIGLLGEA